MTYFIIDDFFSIMPDWPSILNGNIRKKSLGSVISVTTLMLRKGVLLNIRLTFMPRKVISNFVLLVRIRRQIKLHSNHILTQFIKRYWGLLVISVPINSTKNINWQIILKVRYSYLVIKGVALMQLSNCATEECEFNQISKV